MDLNLRAMLPSVSDVNILKAPTWFNGMESTYRSSRSLISRTHEFFTSSPHTSARMHNLEVSVDVAYAISNVCAWAATTGGYHFPVQNVTFGCLFDPVTITPIFNMHGGGVSVRLDEPPHLFIIFRHASSFFCLVMFYVGFDTEARNSKFQTSRIFVPRRFPLFPCSPLLTFHQTTSTIVQRKNPPD